MLPGYRFGSSKNFLILFWLIDSCLAKLFTKFDTIDDLNYGVDS